MKIGIFTFFGALNFGVNMQALAGYHILKKMYPNDHIEFINVQRVNKKFYRPSFRNPTIKSVINDFRKIRLYKALKNSMCFSKNAIVTTNYEKATKYIMLQHYDKIYVGAESPKVSQ